MTDTINEHDKMCWADIVTLWARAPGSNQASPPVFEAARKLKMLRLPPRERPYQDQIDAIRKEMEALGYSAIDGDIARAWSDYSEAWHSSEWHSVYFDGPKFAAKKCIERMLDQ